MNYCGTCGQPTEKKIPEGDDRERHCCEACGHIHYYNPKMIVVCLPRWQDKVLMCKRGIEPRHGFWTLPGGFMELDETTEQGAIRETWEETRAEVEIERLHGVYNMPQINQVYFVYLANMLTPYFETTPESTDIQLLEHHEIPWDQLAFKVIKTALQQYVDDQPYGNNGVHHDVITFEKNIVTDRWSS